MKVDIIVVVVDTNRVVDKDQCKFIGVQIKLRLQTQVACQLLTVVNLLEFSLSWDSRPRLLASGDDD